MANKSQQGLVCGLGEKYCGRGWSRHVYISGRHTTIGSAGSKRNILALASSPDGRKRYFPGVPACKEFWNGYLMSVISQLIRKIYHVMKLTYIMVGCDVIQESWWIRLCTVFFSFIIWALGKIYVLSPSLFHYGHVPQPQTRLVTTIKIKWTKSRSK